MYNNTINPYPNTNTNNSYETLLNLNDVKVGVENIDDITNNYKLLEEDECIICREEFEKGNLFKQLINCKHSFCLYYNDYTKYNNN